MYFSEEIVSDNDTQIDTDVIVAIFKKRTKRERHFYFFDDERNAWF
jgi:hypothetical protein